MKKQHGFVLFLTILFFLTIAFSFGQVKQVPIHTPDFELFQLQSRFTQLDKLFKFNVSMVDIQECLDGLEDLRGALKCYLPLFKGDDQNAMQQVHRRINDALFDLSAMDYYGAQDLFKKAKQIFQDVYRKYRS
ncbi:MAG: hypothetical protein HQM08_16250 [Candidatus Riflebacteria bacterium]|nr:hypothetical protein [Candidatus Riflebacteria bacterium]